MTLTPEQLEKRLDYITGSDAAVICGVSPWGNKVELWQQKVRMTRAPDIGDNPAVRAGNYLEPVVRQWFCDDTGLKVELDHNLIIHPTISYMAANIDGRILSEKSVFEAKTAGYDINWGVQGESMIPDHYLCQVAHYVAVEDAERAHVAVLIRGSDFRHYVYERNHKLEEMILAKEKAFWGLVKSETPPEPSTADEVISLYGYQTDEEPAIANSELERRLFELKKVKETIKGAQEKQKKLEDTVKVYMGKHDTLLGQSGNVVATWKKPKPARKFNAALFKEEHNDLYEKYKRESASSRRFLVK